MTVEDTRASTPDDDAKRPYVAPKLVEIGRVRDLTAGLSGSGGDFSRKKK